LFRPVPADIDLTALEAEELARWRDHRIFERSIELRDGAEPWVFYEGPPTANGKPGLHHVWARIYKDLFCRYRTMRGFQVRRKAGWDTHGLPVEVEVEKRLGITTKSQIEDEVGIAEFTRLCRESVRAYVDDWQRLSERIGYWIDFDDAYWTFDPRYVESVWSQLKAIWDDGLLYRDIKVVPYCPRCGTALSSHELGQPDVYQPVVDESAYVRLPLVDGDPAGEEGGDPPGEEGEDPAVTGAVAGDDASAARNDDGPAARARRLAGLLGRDHLEGISLVAWTTTPWTLLSNTGAAVGPDLDYGLVGDEIVAVDLVASVFGEEATVTHRVKGADLVGLRYRRPFDDLAADPRDGTGWRVVAGAFVEADEGTGIVHLAPAFGEIDRQVGVEAGLPTLNPVGPDGRFTPAVAWLAGRAVRETNADVNEALASKGLLVRRHPYTHAYPHCWRCGTALIYWGKPSWYIRTSARKEALVRENRGIGWHPEHIREGRMGEWLQNNVDWALSRDRYWGTPLPVWECGRHGHTRCVGSLAELSELAGRDVDDIDPHRPAIDDVTFPCPDCLPGDHAGEPTSIMSRVEPVIDAWFDSGSMPTAQWGHPVTAADRSAGSPPTPFPADFICEAIDQTRGWFYSLLAVNTLVYGHSPYRNVLCLGHIVDVDGRKMSKSVGNVIDPWEIIETRGVDALRWWMFSQGSPWTPTRVGLAAIDASLRDTMLTLWNTWAFFTTYASLNGFDPADPLVPPVPDRPVLDRWLASRLAATVDAVTGALDGYEPYPAATAIAELVDDLSNWYVRRSRRRFWRTDPGMDPADGLAAQATLHDALVTVARLLAPMCPFLADRLWRDLTGAGESDSIHLEDWPAPRPEAADPNLEQAMALSRRLASLGRAARAEAGVRVRQPLSRALVHLPPGAPSFLEEIVAEELNVDAVEVTSDLGDVLAYELVPNFKLLGPRLGPRVQELRTALAALDAAAVAEELAAGRVVAVEVAGDRIELGADELELRVQGQGGFAVSRDGAEVVALDLALDDDLVTRGLAREVVRHVQDGRKAAGLAVSDSIHLRLDGLDRVASLGDTIAREVLADSVAFGPPGGGVVGDGGGSDGAVGSDPGTPFDIEDGAGTVHHARMWITRA